MSESEIQRATNVRRGRNFLQHLSQSQTNNEWNRERNCNTGRGVMKVRRRRNFLTKYVTVAHQKLMKSSTTLKYRSDENPPQAKFFKRICHSRTQISNEILNEIEMHELRKPVVGEIFYNICHSRTQIINEILNEIVIQVQE